MAFAEFYALMPPDNAATVAAGSPVEFPRNGPSSAGIARASATAFTLSAIGTYRVTFSVTIAGPAQLVIALNSGSGFVELPYTVFGRATGATVLSGEALVVSSVVNSSIELINPAGSVTALSVMPEAGGSHASVASLVVQRLS